MDEITKIEEKIERGIEGEIHSIESGVKTIESEMIHLLLSHSYVIFLIAIVAGSIFHLFYPIRLFDIDQYNDIASFGFFMIMLGSAIIYWAQSTTSITRKQGRPRTASDFEKGPYKYSRNPTHIGITIMTLGLAVVLNSFFTVLFLIVTSLITKFIFVKKEEALLEEKYGKPYRDYKAKVRTWV